MLNQRLADAERRREFEHLDAEKLRGDIKTLQQSLQATQSLDMAQGEMYRDGGERASERALKKTIIRATSLNFVSLNLLCASLRSAQSPPLLPSRQPPRPAFEH